MNSTTAELFNLLGVRPYEEFNVTNNDYSTYLITEFLDVQYKVETAPGLTYWVPSTMRFKDFVLGSYAIIKAPRHRPVEDETYYYVEPDGSIVSETWNDDAFDFMCYRLCNCFQSLAQITPEIVTGIVDTLYQ